jgi:hypothetical protein
LSVVGSEVDGSRTKTAPGEDFLMIARWLISDESYKVGDCGLFGIQGAKLMAMAWGWDISIVGEDRTPLEQAKIATWSPDEWGEYIQTDVAY